MENFHYPYMIPQKKLQKDEIWEEEEGPTTSQLEAELISCDVCRRTFRSKKALWGHRRCCKIARADYQNDDGRVSGHKHDVLQSGWCVTDKRGRKPVIRVTSPEFVAADILIFMSSRKNGSVISIQSTEQKNTEMEESQMTSDSLTTSVGRGNKFVCVVCGKIFPSYQALGGHKASHGKDEMMVNSVKYEKEVKRSKGMISSDHRCDVCGECYPSGQALGGHKRKHWPGPSFVTGNRTRASDVDASMFAASRVACI